MRKTLRVLGVVFTFLLVNITFDLLIGSGLGLLLNSYNIENLTLYILILSQILKLILVLVFLKLRSKKFHHQYGLTYIKNKNLDSDFYKIITIAFGVAGFGNILLSVFLKIFENNDYINTTLETLETMLNYNSTFEYLVLFASVVIIAPILEELLFRGILFSETKKYLNVTASMVINGLCFAIYHMNIIQGINTFFMGMVLSYVYYYRRNIKEAIAIHMVNNFIAMVMDVNYYLTIIMGTIAFISIIFAIKYLREFKQGL
ncbi:type II CAAX endopeptidase family protein [uncultured Anaerococcus sp.]|uniref:CPBP family intramembrane glutamic endopeptidase n=1 Tax=uncultured Anaerococcus sp. TaxID=293428 RepID=UPI00280BB9BF|nr:type II CAAX endopeptidase family protein [uncultured Anaerococcus sp.]